MNEQSLDHIFVRDELYFTKFSKLVHVLLFCGAICQIFGVKKIDNFSILKIS